MTQYTAMVLREAGKPLAAEQREIPSPKPGEALVRLTHAALNHRDLWIRKGAYGNITGLPCIPGSDGFGKVESVGSEADKRWIGSSVVLFPALEWGEDDSAPHSAWRILGVPDAGTFAEYIVIPTAQLFPAPKNFTPEEAAALPLAGVTAHRSLFRRGGLKAGEKVLITGIGGGTAQFLLQFAVAAGADVWATSSSAEKIGAAKKQGAKGGVLYTSESWPEELIRDAGLFDLCVDSAAGPGWSGICDALKPGGRLVFFGAIARSAPGSHAQGFFQAARFAGKLHGFGAGFLRDVGLRSGQEHPSGNRCRVSAGTGGGSPAKNGAGFAERENHPADAVKRHSDFSACL